MIPDKKKNDSPDKPLKNIQPKVKKAAQDSDNTEVLEDIDIEVYPTGAYERAKLLAPQKPETQPEKSVNASEKFNVQRDNVKRSSDKNYPQPEKIQKSDAQLLKLQALEKIDALREKEIKAMKLLEEQEKEEKRKTEAAKELEKNGKIRPKKGWKKRDYMEVGIMPPQNKFIPLILLLLFLAGSWFLVEELMLTDVAEEGKPPILSKYEIQLNELKEKYALLYKQQQDSKIQLEAAKKNIEEAQKKLVEHSKLIKANKDSITESEGKIKKIDGEILRLAKDAVKNADELKKLNDEKEKIEKDIEDLKKTDDELMKKQNELENKQNEYQKQQDEIKEQVKENRKSITDLMLKQLNLEKESKQTKEELQRLKDYLKQRGIIPEDFDWDDENKPEGNQP